MSKYQKLLNGKFQCLICLEILDELPKGGIYHA